MATITTLTPRDSKYQVRFAVPASLGQGMAGERAKKLESFLTAALRRPTQVVVPPTYEALAKELLSGRIEAAWAPPFVCARIEAMGVRVLVRGVRLGTSSYRGALVAKAGSGLTLDTLKGKIAVWSDRDSVGGYLLPLALMRSKGMEPSRTFSSQTFAGSYKAALEEVLAGTADLTSVFAPSPKPGAADVTGLSEVIPGREAKLEVLSFTDESPNDGVAVSMNAPAPLVQELEKVMTGLHESPEGAELLKDIFSAERFELAPRMGYRALYRVALASL